MKILRELFKKVKPIYIILGLFVVVIIISALGSKKEGYTGGKAYYNATLDQLVADRDDIIGKMDAFVSTHQDWDRNNTFLSNIVKFITLQSTYTYQNNVQDRDINKDGIIVVDSSDYFVRDNSSTDTDNSGNTLQSGEKLFHYNPLGNKNGVKVSQQQVFSAQNIITNQINLLQNVNDKALLNDLFFDLLAKCGTIDIYIVDDGSPIVSFQKYRVPYPINLDAIHKKVFQASNSHASNSYASNSQASNSSNFRPTGKSPFVTGTSPPTIEWAAARTNTGNSPWSASVCGDNSTLASSASIDCINSLWQQNGCTPNLIKTSNPNFLMDSKTNQLYDITNQTLGVMKKMMTETSENSAFCYGSVSPGSDSKTSVNSGCADYWKNLYLSSVSVPSGGQMHKDYQNQAEHKLAGSDSANKNPSYDSTFIPSDAALAGDGKGDLSSGTGIGSGSDSSGNNTGSSGSSSSGSSSSGSGTSGVVGLASLAAAPLTQDSYLLSNQAGSNCPVGGCGTGASSSTNNLKASPVPPCPPCERCPEPAFDCKKVPSYGKASNNQYLPRPVLADFSQFGM